MASLTTRVSSYVSDRASVSAMRRQQAEVAITQREVASGKREIRDPAEINSAEALKAFLVRSERYQENSQLATYRLGLVESGLASAMEAMQTAREFVVNANTASVNPESRPILAIQVREMRRVVLYTRSIILILNYLVLPVGGDIIKNAVSKWNRNLILFKGQMVGK